jgi:D-alanyl-D-alanine carboxypeptidase (penicillin-binding protein 5/6)
MHMSLRPWRALLCLVVLTWVTLGDAAPAQAVGGGLPRIRAHAARDTCQRRKPRRRPRERRAPAATIARDPYIGAIALDAATGRVLAEDQADTQGYPASVVKLMNLLVVLEALRQGKAKLDDPVTVTAEAARTGGSQVYLKEGEVFPLEELLYALMVQSANDAATALAIHLAGSRPAFVELMNRKAEELGLRNTRFASVHGLPPSEGQEFDRSTARDLALLGRALLALPETLRLSSTQERGFRNGTFVMRTHNRLLNRVPGCDGLKTGFIRAGGFSIALTGAKGEQRVVVVVLGSPDRKTRDRKAEELYHRAFALLPGLAAGSPLPAALPSAPPSGGASPAPAQTQGEVPLATPPAAPPDPGACREWLWTGLGLALGLALGFVLFGWRRRATGLSS